MAKNQFRMLRSALSGVEAVEAETHHSFARHTHEQFGIGLMSAGAQSSLSGRGMVEAEAGDIITVNPNEVHDGAPIGEGRSWRILYFDPAIVSGLSREVSKSGVGRSEIPHPVIRNAGIAARFETLFRTVTGDGAADELLHEELLLQLVADVMRERSGTEGRPLVPASIRAARNLIDDDPLAAVSLADLSRESGLSRFQVLRGFAKATGLTPHAYLVQARIHIARRLIAQGMPLAEAAFASGFADQSHMTRVFVSKYGLSPRLYAGAFL
ncbi:AraC family transcriptional regulator [Rhizobium ruizarguesonis]|uniref:AraC family transcriptional regulator n=1 Tax=Rhizobium ruizarguesonis TaxID=2081791 RepID=UPI00102F9299|nr:AraC family transcriptional regulator [Rhizobium ruizarguesonis]NKL46397.1 helix-turn-helix domain-containing protein [Rhizobium leguminosarum bv. viciae]NEJ02518.1 helix-turn-helix domain-containing protein [Rhizobium ruizarguesonis]NEJ35364.1 helix-turn-helix domain-containing protein [Rhizobium ruizarguesonis]TBE07491.1 AraC family transcriptional regulator [Rhizobium ruizarguesonis]TBE78715.1 AraC family transcriptional regulator [Rhizobium ruizarguesonis]